MSLTVLGHSKVRKGIVNQTSKGTFAIVSWRRTRMLWRTSFLMLWSQNPYILCRTCFLAYFQPKQMLLSIFGHSKVGKVVVNHAFKGTIVIIFWIRIRIWWRTLFTILWSQNTSILCWTWFFDLFKTQSGPEKQHRPSRCSSLPTQLTCIKAKNIYFWDFCWYFIILLEVMPPQAEFTRKRFS